MQFLLSDQEAIDAIRNGKRRDNGLLLIRIPAVHLQDTDESHYTLNFSPDSHTVHWGKRSMRLSPTLYSLLHYLTTRNHASFEQLQDEIWGKRVSDDVIYKAISRLSSRLLDAEIPWACFTRQSSVILEENSLF